MKRGLTTIDVLILPAIVLMLVSLFAPLGLGSRDEEHIKACMGNLRVLGAASLQYAQDWDRSYAIAVPTADGRNQETFWGIPAERPSNGVKPSRSSMDIRRSFWSNATFPYVGTWEYHRNAAAVRHLYPSFFRADDLPNMPSSSYALNTYLNSYPVDAVMQPSTTVLFFQGMGRMSVLGVGYNYPPINAGTLAAPWRFDRSNPNMCPWGLYIYTTQASAQVFGGGHTLAYADGSADFVHTPSSRSPWAALNERTGVPTSIWLSNVTGQSPACNNKIYYHHAPDIGRVW